MNIRKLLGKELNYKILLVIHAVAITAVIVLCGGFFS